MPKRVVIFAGKSHEQGADRIIQLIIQVANVVNNDPIVGNTLKIVFLPDYNVSLAELIMPAVDVF